MAFSTGVHPSPETVRRYAALWHPEAEARLAEERDGRPPGVDPGAHHALTDAGLLDEIVRHALVEPVERSPQTTASAVMGDPRGSGRGQRRRAHRA